MRLSRKAILAFSGAVLAVAAAALGLQAGESWVDAAHDLSAHEKGGADEATLALAVSARRTSYAAMGAALLFALMAGGAFSHRLRRAVARWADAGGPIPLAAGGTTFGGLPQAEGIPRVGPR